MKMPLTTTGGLSSRQWTMTNHYQKISPFAVDKALKGAVENVKSIKCLRSGDLLVEVGTASQSRTHSLPFHTASVPKHIKIGYLHTPVELYIPNSLRCFNWQKFGHGKSHVKEEKSAPSVDRLDTMAVLAAMTRNARTA